MGIAGCFAAIKAGQKVKNVTLVDKGYVSRSGQSPYAGAIMVFNPELGHKLDTWVDFVSMVGEYINNREWTEVIINDSYPRYQDLVSWGVKFPQGDGAPPGPPSPLGGNETLRIGTDTLQILRQQVVKSGVKIIDRVMVTELLKQNNKITGAMGISTDRDDLYVFRAKSTVLCTGAAGFKPPGWPISNLTADGHAMAYRAGAEISGKEFLDTHFTRADRPAARGGMGPGPRPPADPEAEKEQSRPRKSMVFVNAEGDEISSEGLLVGQERYLALEHEAHAGRAPLLMRGNPVVGGTASGMSVHSTEGLWPVNTLGASSLPGLYAAGDSCSTMQSGAVYAIAGSALMTAAVTGARAGTAAAEFSLHADMPALDNDGAERLKRIIYTPFERKGGFSPRWVTQLLQNLMIPYYVMYIKHEKRLQATLTLVEFLRDF
ncbi:MAG: FAD-binding protein [Deltaproteobacteria bacterium]|nr:FAD-binding protein [Deltaproteobacteria bacterium]